MSDTKTRQKHKELQRRASIKAPKTRQRRNQLRVYIQPRKPTDEYSAPQWLYDLYDRSYHFTCDVAASGRNHKHRNYFTRGDDALSKRWYGVLWCNPPYSNVGPWVKKAYEASLDGAIVVMLLPCWMAQWFFDYVLPYADIHYLRGRLKYELPNGTKFTAYFDSMLVTFPKDKACNVLSPRICKWP